MVLEMPNAVKDFPFGDDVAVYKVGSTEGKMFALIRKTERSRCGSVSSATAACRSYCAKNTRLC